MQLEIGPHVIHHGDSRDVLAAMPDASVDAVVCDPPYALVSNPRASAGFMGQSWDTGEVAFATEFWAQVLRVLKPGGHVVAFSGTRTYHRLAVAIEDSGFEIRDQLAWVYGSGFPKSHDVSKAIDKMDAVEARRERQLRFCAFMRSSNLTRGSASTLLQNAGLISPNGTMAGHFFAASEDGQPAVATRELFEAMRPHLGIEVPEWIEQMVDERTVESENFKNREIVGKGASGKTAIWNEDGGMGQFNITTALTPQAQQWEGWGTALKPSHEPVVLARKPLTPDAERDITVRNLLKVRAKLWLMLSAITAESRFQLNPVEQKEAFDFVQWDAEKLSSTLDDLSGLTDTCQFESVLTTSLNTVTSWLSTLEGLSQLPNTSITKTTCDTTTDWKTLRFCTSQITPLSIIPAKMLQSGHNALAGTAERYLVATFAKLTATLELSALGNAIDQAQADSQEEDDRVHKQPIVLARKPLIGTVAANVLEHGTGAINIDGCRVPTTDNLNGGAYAKDPTERKEIWGQDAGNSWVRGGAGDFVQPEGRFPANILHDGDQFGEQGRYFYSPKASKKDRGEGNTHPTVKPRDLMAYLCRLVTPPGGVVLDPFMGSGSTGLGAHNEGFRFIGIEREEAFFDIAANRLLDHTCS